VEAPQVRFADDAIYLLRLDFLMMQHGLPTPSQRALASILFSRLEESFSILIVADISSIIGHFGYSTGQFAMSFFANLMGNGHSLTA
jgi:hypothetical protein